jgi:hypothetical protein
MATQMALPPSLQTPDSRVERIMRLVAKVIPMPKSCICLKALNSPSSGDALEMVKVR